MDILQELKIRTAEQHLAIEQVVPLMRDEVTLADYESYLRAFLGFIDPMEDELAKVPKLLDWLPDFALRSKADLLRADLRALGEREWELAEVKLCPRIPAVRSIAEAMGCLYVLEGSTLGGQILQRHLAARLGARFEHASSYLSSYGQNLSSMWRTFGQHLKTAVANERDRADAVSSAAQTFDALRNWLETSAVHWSPVIK